MNQQNELPWIAEGRKYIGLKEAQGIANNPTILGWLKSLKSFIKDDATPWCGTFVAYCCQFAGRGMPTHWYRAIEWANVGKRLDKPAYGCIVVFERKGGGHVGFVVGKDAAGNLMVLGGNQGDKVSIAPFAVGRVKAYVWPSIGGTIVEPTAGRYNLPLLTSNGVVSQNES